MDAVSPGKEMYRWMADLFPICRSLTGDGVRETLRYLGGLMPGLRMHEVPSGTQCFDWTVPDEWNIRDAYVADMQGNRLIDFRASNLHVVGYSEPVDTVVPREELDARLFSLPDQPDAIPYVTSYYKRTWGFCIAHDKREALGPGPFRVVIDSTLAPGHMTCADLFLPGRSEKTVVLSTYVCHPSMANNELSGPVLQAAVARHLMQRDRELSYLLVFVPETIGTIWYLSQHLAEMQRNVVAGFVLSCTGDDRAWSYLPSRQGNTLSDRTLLHVLGAYHPDFKRYTFLDRASDERQYNSPGVDLPIIPFARSLYRHYPEYHTSLDDLSVVSPAGLDNSFTTLTRCLDIIENNHTWRATCLCEPQLGKRGLYPTTSVKNGYCNKVNIIIDFLAYADGTLDLVEIADRIGVPADECIPVVRELAAAGVLALVDGRG